MGTSDHCPTKTLPIHSSFTSRVSSCRIPARERLVAGMHVEHCFQFAWPSLPALVRHLASPKTSTESGGIAFSATRDEAAQRQTVRANPYKLLARPDSLEDRINAKASSQRLLIEPAVRHFRRVTTGWPVSSLPMWPLATSYPVGHIQVGRRPSLGKYVETHFQTATTAYTSRTCPVSHLACVATSYRRMPRN